METSTVLIIVGVTGDLSTRKLLPAIGEMAAAGVLPKKFRILGISRQHAPHIEDLLGNVKNAAYVRAHLELFSMSGTDATDYGRLQTLLADIDDCLGGEVQHLWYLAVPPNTTWPIVEQLGSSGLAHLPGTKLLLEKPFGVDRVSAQELITHIQRWFTEEQVYRIDHYLAKETVQNIVVFRRDNPVFERTWNRGAIERIDILASEVIGIEQRAVFYEQTGALRDLVQSHLLQLAALTLMTLPEKGEWGDIPNARHEILASLKVVPGSVHFGQYETYRKEVENPTSVVETFVSLTLSSRDPRWQDVPITLTTGKALADKETKIVVTYRADSVPQKNQLTLRLQPNEGIELCFFAKRPGYDRRIEQVPLSFTYADHFDVLPDAYERVLLDALRGDHALFASSNEVIESWRITDAARKEWGNTGKQIPLYATGTDPKQVIAEASTPTRTD